MEITPFVPSDYALVRADPNGQRLPPIRSGELVSKSDEPPGYTIQNTRYLLPAAGYQQSTSDHNLGQIESWPTNASGTSGAYKSLALNHHGRLVPTGTSLRGKLDTAPKPRFLATIEDYLYSELKALGVENATGSEARLQVFREAFSAVIDDFKTYKPLLSSIKNEYEIMLNYYRDRIRELEPLSQELVLLSEECDKKLMKYREEEREEIFLLKQQNRNLEQTIRQLTNHNQNLEANIQRLQEEVSNQYEMYRKELDARKLLINDANDLRYQQERRVDDKQGIDESGMKKEDTIMMKIALKQARKDLDLALAKVTHMEANYNEVVPRRDFVALEAKSNAYLERIKEFQTINDNQAHEIEQAHAQNENLREEVQRLQREREELIAKNEMINEEMTPRPSWHLAGEVIDGGAERWQHMSNNKTSHERLVILLNEFTGGGNDDDGSGSNGQLSAIPDQLPPYGEGEHVPFHLRSSKPVKNRRLTRRDVAVLIQEIWSERRESDRQDGRTKTLPEFLYEFFRNRYGNHNTAVEMGYNIDYACKRFKYNDNCQLFHQILSGTTDENVYHHAKHLIEQLGERIIKEGESKPDGSVTNEQFTEMLTRNLPEKSTTEIAELVAAAEKEQPNEERISLAKLFSVDDEDNYGEFIRVFKRQLQEDKERFIHDVQERIENSSSVNAKDLEQTIKAVHPTIRPNDISQVIQWTFEAKDGSQVASMSVQDVMQRLENGVFYRQHTLA